MRAYYANARAVFFAPYREDYGYITLEAMLSAKPVITCKDSGGVLEFVEDGLNGRVLDPTAEAVAEAIEAYASKTLAVEHGASGFDRYAAMNVSWDNKTIAIVSPSPVPFVNGGIENLTWSLAGYLNGAGDVHVELIKVPSPEYDFESLMTSYERFSLLDLTHFDSIISVKYPAWMVRHPDHRIYMAHCLRGLYDTYPEQQMGLSLPAGAPAEVEKLWSIVNRKHFDRYDLPAIFDAAQKVLREGGNSAWTALPSPLVRSVVHRLDAIAMRDVSVFSAISATVAKRKSYFPAEAQVHVAVPPSGLVPKSPDAQDYIFTVSRLDAPKRIDLLVQAMRQTKGETRLLIAGTGPQLSVLKQLAGEDARIEFVGYISV
ncbi:hypothetical protein G6F57_015938 [Rhizopus arrhizus]|nr:hypothetical protein G6F57_015938 [Rhizopus arrhizus]